MKNRLLKLRRLLHHLEDGALILLLAGLLLIAVVQIVLRNLGQGGLLFADEAMRNAVLWLAFFGAMRASRLQNHIAINLLEHLKNRTLKQSVHFIISLFSAVVCAVAAYYCYRYTLIEWEGGQAGFLDIPLWFLQAVMPFALGVIAIRCLVYSTRLPEHDARV